MDNEFHLRGCRFSKTQIGECVLSSDSVRWGEAVLIKSSAYRKEGGVGIERYSIILLSRILCARRRKLSSPVVATCGLYIIKVLGK